MAKDIPFNISRKSITYLVLCAGGILAFVLFAILPAQRSLTQLDQDITAAKVRLKTQEVLYPLYTSLQEQLEQKDDLALPFPVEEAIAMASVSDFISSFKKMARESHLKVVNISPNFQSPDKAADRLSCNALLRGKFIDLRQLLEKIGGVAALQQMEEIQVSAAPGYNEIHLKFWLALRS